MQPRRRQPALRSLETTRAVGQATSVANLPDGQALPIEAAVTISEHQLDASMPPIPGESVHASPASAAPVAAKPVPASRVRKLIQLCSKKIIAKQRCDAQLAEVCEFFGVDLAAATVGTEPQVQGACSLGIRLLHFLRVSSTSRFCFSCRKL